MSAKERFDLLDKDASILESISKKYEVDSKEYSALRHAAIAFGFVLTEDYERFKEYLDNFDKDLTPDQRARLIGLGIDPDADPDSI